MEVTESVCTTRQLATHLKNVELKTSTELNMSEADLSLAVLEFDRDLDQPLALNCLSSLDELVDILGIREAASLDHYQYTDAIEPPYRNTFNTEDRWPI